MAAKLAVLASNALRNYDVDRVLELLEEIRRICDATYKGEALRSVK